MKWINMELVPSTYEILAFKFFNQGVDERWADWAIEMMEAGFETESLSMLALLDKPYNQFELNEMTGRIFNELNLNYWDQEQIIPKYVDFLLDQVINGHRDAFKVIRILSDLYMQLDCIGSLQDFYLLYFAKDDLEYGTETHYWNDVNQSNIDQVILNYFKRWRTEKKSDKLFK